MPGDQTTKILLLTMIALLALLLFKPDFTPSPSYAAKPVQYKVVSQKVESFEDLEAALNGYGSEGWELVAYGFGPMIFKR